MNSRQHTGHPHQSDDAHDHHHHAHAHGHPAPPAKSGCCGGGSCGSKPHAHDEDHDHDHDHAAGGGCCGGSGASAGGCCGGGSASHAPTEQVYVFSKRQIRELDRLAVDEFALPSILLMENAARGVASVILEALASIPNPTALILCGPGNNGGDGFAVARHLHNRNVQTAVILAADESKLSGDALTNYTIIKKMGIRVFDAHRHTDAAFQQAVGQIGQPHIIIDALLGTGADRPTTGTIAQIITMANKTKEQGTSIISVDVPSGLDADTGRPLGFDEGAPGPTIQADLTIALAGVKAGYMSPIARPYVGEMVVVDIGAPVELVQRLGHPLS